MIDLFAKILRGQNAVGVVGDLPHTGFLHKRVHDGRRGFQLEDSAGGPAVRRRRCPLLPPGNLQPACRIRFAAIHGDDLHVAGLVVDGAPVFIARVTDQKVCQIRIQRVDPGSSGRHGFFQPGFGVMVEDKSHFKRSSPSRWSRCNVSTRHQWSNCRPLRRYNWPSKTRPDRLSRCARFPAAAWPPMPLRSAAARSLRRPKTHRPECPG